MPRVRLSENVRYKRLIVNAYVFSPLFRRIAYADFFALAVYSVSVGVLFKPPGRRIGVEHEHELGGRRTLKGFVNDFVQSREIVFAVTRPHRTRAVHIVAAAVRKTHKVYVRAVHSGRVLRFENGFLLAKIHHRRDFFAVYDKLNSAVLFFDMTFRQNDFFCRYRDVFASDYIAGISAVRDFELFGIELKLITVRREIIGNFHSVSDDIILADNPFGRFFARNERGNEPVFHNFVFVGDVFASEVYLKGKILRYLFRYMRVERKFERIARVYGFRYLRALYGKLRQRFRVLFVNYFAPRHARRRADDERRFPCGIVKVGFVPVIAVELFFSRVIRKNGVVRRNAHFLSALQSEFEVEKKSAVIRLVINAERKRVFADNEVVFNMRYENACP